MISRPKLVLQPLLAMIAILVLTGAGEVSAQTCQDSFVGTISAVEEYALETESLEPMDVRVKPLVTGAEGLAAKLVLIEKATKTLDLSYYILKRDTAGYALLHAVEEAMKRGVKVRILVDGVGSFHGTNSHLQTLVAFVKTLPESRLEVKVFNPIFSLKNTIAKLSAYLRSGNFLFSPGDANNRLHDKILLIDAGTENSWAVLGGRNIGNDYYGLNGLDREIVDYEILVKGQATSQSSDSLEPIAKHFELLFKHDLNLRIWNQLIFRGIERADDHQTRRRAAFDRLNSSEDIAAAMKTMRTENYWHDGFESTASTFVTEAQNVLKDLRKSIDHETWISTGDRKNVTQSVFDLMATAKKSVTLISPYVFFNVYDIQKLRRWLITNPDATFELYTNSIHSTNQRIVTATLYAFTLPELRKLQADPKIGSRLKVYLYKGDQLLHAKAIAIDDVTSFVTTSNFDPRSRILNSEIGLWMSSKLNHQAILDLAAKIKTKSVSVSPETSLLEKPRDMKKALEYAAYRYISRFMVVYRLVTFL